MSQTLMIQGTASDVGKSVIVTGLCRLFSRQGLKVIPFKSQNMSLNTYLTEKGEEIAISQAVQAQAAGLEPSVLMNPILLKPSSDSGSELVFLGESKGHYSAQDYQAMKVQLKEDLQNIIDQHRRDFDLLMIEGAGSPAEINLNQDDLVNMGLADMAEAPVILVADINRGGVFASIYGTIKLLKPEWQGRIRGMIINKFRGDIKLLEPGLRQLEELTGVPVLGVLPYDSQIISQEDSLIFDQVKHRYNHDGSLDVAILNLPRIPNIHHYTCLLGLKNLSIRRIDRETDFASPDLLIIPDHQDLNYCRTYLEEANLSQVLEAYLDRGGHTLVLGQSVYLLDNLEDYATNSLTVTSQKFLEDPIKIIDYLNQIACQYHRPMIYQEKSDMNSFDTLADLLEAHLDINQIMAIIEKGGK